MTGLGAVPVILSDRTWNQQSWRHASQFRSSLASIASTLHLSRSNFAERSLRCFDLGCAPSLKMDHSSGPPGIGLILGEPVGT